MGLFNINHIGKTSLSCVFWTRSLSLSLSQRMTLCSTSHVLSYLHSSLGTAWLSKDALLLKQSPALSKGQAHNRSSPWKRAEWPWTRAPLKAKCSNHFFDLGFVQQRLWKDVNLQPLLALSHVKTEAKQKRQSRALVRAWKKWEWSWFVHFNFWKTSAHGCWSSYFCVALADYARHNPEI